MIKKAVGILAAVTGFVAAIVALLTAPGPMRAIALWLLLGVTIGLLSLLIVPEAFRQYRAKRSLPSERDLDDLSSGYQVAQATGSEIAWIAALEASVYSKEDAIPEHLLREWYAVNPSGFWIIKDSSGKPIGHLDLLPLRPATLEAFCKGDIVEREIRGDSLYSENERKLITVLYVESVILRPERPQTPRSATICMLENLAMMLERTADFNTLAKIYAIAASPAGEKLMRRLGFELERPGERRKDGHPLFVARPSDMAKSVARLCRNQSSRSPQSGSET